MTGKSSRSSKKSPHRKSTSSKSNIRNILFSRGMLIFLTVVAAAGLLWWFLPNILNWLEDFWLNLIHLFGFGLVLIAILLISFISIILMKKHKIFIRYWHICVGVVLLLLFLWGLLTIIDMNLGGQFGTNIITESKLLGSLRLSGLFLLGILFIIPRWTGKHLYKLIKSVGSFIIKIPKLFYGIIHNSIKTKQTKIKIKEKIPVLNIGKDIQATKNEVPEAKEERYYKPTMTIGGWQLPPLSILDKPSEPDITPSDVEKRAELITESLASYGVDAKIAQINIGPTVTQFGVEPGWDKKYKEIRERDKDGNIKIRQQEVSKTRVKVERISSLANDLALALAAPSIRIEAPVPGKSIVGIEVPNSTFGSVNLRSIIESTVYQKLGAKSKLAIPLGKGAGGEVVAGDLSKMPHLLIAGSTGSGKTVYINSIICCLLFNNTPDELNFIMIDPKRVELVNFNGLPHLIAPVVVEPDKAVSALHWLTQEMDHRYVKFAEAGTRNIESYNKNRPPGESLPYILLFIDELADLMMTAFGEVEHTLCRLAQLARATGIHLIVATQRPSVDVITGLIKANFPTRISFSLTSQIDSRTILDGTGAEKLLGRGDMLYMPTDASKPKRLQGPFLSDAEIERLVKFWSDQPKKDNQQINFEEVKKKQLSDKDEDEEILISARKLASEYSTISTSFLQRKLKLGYPRAARIMEKLKEEGY